MGHASVQPRASLLPKKTITFNGEDYKQLEDEARLYGVATAAYTKIMIQKGRGASKDERDLLIRKKEKNAAGATTGP